MKATITTIFFCIISSIDSTKCQTLQCSDVVQISREGGGDLSFSGNKNCPLESHVCFKASSLLIYNDGSRGEMNISSCIPRVQCSATTCDDFLPAASNYVNATQNMSIQIRMNDVVNVSSCCFGFCSTNQCNDEVSAEQLGCNLTLCTASSGTTTSGTKRTSMMLCLFWGLFAFLFDCFLSDF